MPSVFMASLGCVKNMVDAETALGETLGDGYTLELDPERADIILINTCGFIQDARDEAAGVIEEMLHIKRAASHPITVVAMGCWAEREPDYIKQRYPDLDAIWGLAAPASLRKPLETLASTTIGNNTCTQTAWLGKPAQVKTGARLVTTLPSYAYIKIADGCDNCCSYCAIPLIRGAMKSKPRDAILSEARDLAAQGVKELIIAAQDTTAYGLDTGGAAGPNGNLASLLRELLRVVQVQRIRLLYAHPAHIDDQVMDLLIYEPRLCRYVDLPLQHLADPVLASMGRNYDYARAMAVLEKLKRGDIVIRTTLMAGYPNESEADFELMVKTVRQGWFNHMGAFAYSAEKGTPAAVLPGHIDAVEAARRRDILMEEQAKVAFAWLDSRIGKQEQLLVDGVAGDGMLAARSTAEAPDSDGAVFIRNIRAEPGQIIQACITSRVGYDLLAGKNAGGKAGGKKPHRRRRS